MKQFLSLCLLLLLFAVPRAQKVSVTVDRQEILIGERLQLSLEAVFAPGQPRGWFVIDSIPHFEILHISEIDSQVVEEGLLKKQQLILTSWDSGRWFIPPYVFGRGRTAPIAVNVGYSPMDPNQPYHDIKDILQVEVPRDSTSWWWYLVGALLLIAILMLIFSNSDEAKKEPVIPPQDVYREAMQRLNALDPSGSAREFYTELVDIFRWYLLHRKKISSYSRTTDDLSVHLKKMKLAAKDYEELVEALQRSDGVKFARYQPASQESRESLEVVRHAVRTIEQTHHALRTV